MNPDNTIDVLVEKVWNTAAGTALLEAHRLLCQRQLHEAADALLAHWESILARADSRREAAQIIQRMREPV